MLKIKTILPFLTLGLALYISPLVAEIETPSETITFLPPVGWGIAPRELLTPNVKLMVMGKGQSEYPPSINLTVEAWTSTMKDYLKLVKDLNDSQNIDFKDLGKVNTQAGEAYLVQEDIRTKWGEVRQMHLMFLHKEVVYILTAASLKEEFGKFYKDFFASLTSVKIVKGVFEMVENAQKREALKQKSDDLKRVFAELAIKEKSANPESQPGPLLQQIFLSKNFQKNYWEPFKVMLGKDYSEMDADWQNLLLGQVQTSLING